LWVEASGSVAVLQHAFATRINVYQHAGTLMRAPATNPSVPSSLKGIVRGVSGLDDTVATPTRPAPPPVSFTVGTPCSVYWSAKIATNKPPAYGVYQPYTPCGYAPDQVQGAYGVSGAIGSGNDGTGVTVAILDAYWQKSLVSDLQTYSSNHGLPAPDISLKKFGPYTDRKPKQQAWYGEQSLDTDAVHSMAPGATILYVGANNPGEGLTEAMAWVLDQHAADLTTNSYGYFGESLPQGQILEQESLWQQAGAEGIGTYFSSGDSGDEIVNLGYRTTDYPASSAWVTAVGGTSLGVGADDSYVFETGWGTSISSLSDKAWDPAPPGDYLYGGGGGTSRIFGEPWYQYGVVPASLSGYFGGAGRVVPDIGALGDPNTGFTVGETQTFPDGVRYGEFRLGGTSLSCPLIAGIMALAQQRAGGPLGFINPALYAAYSSDSSIVRDIIDPRTTVAVVRTNWVGNDPSSGQKTFSLRTMNTTGTLHTIRGYDDVTGIGTPWGEAYLDAFGG
jgi:subtilase family serine protease